MKEAAMASGAAPAEPTGVLSPGSMGDVRRANQSLVLGRIAKATAGTYPTRAQIAAATGLTKASVSSLVLDLLDAGLVRETGLNPQGERGRPGVGLELNPAKGVMGMEINVDYISAGVTDLAGNLLHQQTREQDNRNAAPGQVQAALGRLVAEVRGAAEAGGVRVLGGGLAVPGLIDDRTGTVITAPNLGWSGEVLNLGALLPDVPLSTGLFNEANAAALAELRHRPAGDPGFLFVSGEVGVGGGLVIGTEVFTGPHGHAGELGHVVVEPGGAHCSCGGAGCLETLAGQDAIFAAAGIPPRTAPRGTDAGTGAGADAGTHAAVGKPAGERPGYRTRSERLAQLKSALTEEDPRALAAVATAGRALGIAVASTARLFDISSVVLSGHFAVLGDWIRPALLDSLARHAPGAAQPGDITCSAVGQLGAVLGAAESVGRTILDAPHRVTNH